MTDEQQTAKYINGLKYPIQEHVILHDVFSVDEAHNKAMKNERLHSRVPPFKRPMLLEKSLGGDGIQPNSMTVDQPPTQQAVKAPMSTPTTNSVVAKGKKNPYTKPEIDKCYRCDEHGHKSNEGPKRRPVNMVDYEDEDEMQIETEPEDSDFAEDGEVATCVTQRLLCN